MLYKYVKPLCNFWGVFTLIYCILVFYIVRGVFSKTIIPLARVGYEMIIVRRASLTIYPVRTRGMPVKYQMKVQRGK